MAVVSIFLGCVGHLIAIAVSVGLCGSVCLCVWCEQGVKVWLVWFSLLCEPASTSLASVTVRRTGIQALNLTNTKY